MDKEQKQREAIRNKLKKDISEGKVCCDICKKPIDSNDNYISWSVVSECRAYVMCEDCEELYNFDINVSQFTLPLFFNLSSFVINNQNKIIKKLEDKIDKLEKRISSLDIRGEEIF